MVPIKQKIRTDHNLSPKAYRAVQKEAWAEVGNVWHEQILPKHFTRGAIREYRYQPRGKFYERRKQRKFGHRDPLVYTGTLKRAVLRMRDVRSSAPRAGGTVTIKLTGPRYLQPRRQSSKHPNYMLELNALSTRDTQLLARVLDRIITDRLNADGSAAGQGA